MPSNQFFSGSIWFHASFQRYFLLQVITSIQNGPPSLRTNPQHFEESLKRRISKWICGRSDSSGPFFRIPVLSGHDLWGLARPSPKNTRWESVRLYIFSQQFLDIKLQHHSTSIIINPKCLHGFFPKKSSLTPVLHHFAIVFLHFSPWSHEVPDFPLRHGATASRCVPGFGPRVSGSPAPRWYPPRGVCRVWRDPRPLCTWCI